MSCEARGSSNRWPSSLNSPTRQLDNSPSVFLFFVLKIFIVILTGALRLEESGFDHLAMAIREDTAGQILRSETNATNAAHRCPVGALSLRMTFYSLSSLNSPTRQLAKRFFLFCRSIFCFGCYSYCWFFALKLVCE